MPILNDHIQRMDEARMGFIEALNWHCHLLREELRVSELLMHSVVRSLSMQSDATTKLDEELQHRREDVAMHKPHINDAQRQQVSAQIEDTLKRAVKEANLDVKLP